MVTDGYNFEQLKVGILGLTTCPGKRLAWRCYIGGMMVEDDLKKRRVRDDSRRQPSSVTAKFFPLISNSTRKCLSV